MSVCKWKEDSIHKHQDKTYKAKNDNPSGKACLKDSKQNYL